VIYFYILISPFFFPCSYLCTTSFPWQLSMSLGSIADHSLLLLLLSLFPLQWLKLLVPLSLLISFPCLQFRFIFLCCCSYSKIMLLFFMLSLNPFSSYTLSSHLYETLPLTRTDLFFAYGLLLNLKFSEGQISPKKERWVKKATKAALDIPTPIFKIKNIFAIVSHFSDSLILPQIFLRHQNFYL